MSLASANPVLGLQSRKTGLLSGSWDRIHNTIRELFPEKTAACFASATGLSINACEKSLSQKRAISSDALVALLDTDHGYEVLKALMGDSRRKWWKTLKRAVEREAMKAEIADLQKRIDALNGELP